MKIYNEDEDFLIFFLSSLVDFFSFIKFSHDHYIQVCFFFPENEEKKKKSISITNTKKWHQILEILN